MNTEKWQHIQTTPHPSRVDDRRESGYFCFTHYNHLQVSERQTTTTMKVGSIRKIVGKSTRKLASTVWNSSSSKALLAAGSKDYHSFTEQEEDTSDSIGSVNSCSSCGGYSESERSLSSLHCIVEEINDEVEVDIGESQSNSERTAAEGSTTGDVVVDPYIDSEVVVVRQRRSRPSLRLSHRANWKYATEEELTNLRRGMAAHKEAIYRQRSAVRALRALRRSYFSGDNVSSDRMMFSIIAEEEETSKGSSSSGDEEEDGNDLQDHATSAQDGKKEKKRRESSSWACHVDKARQKYSQLKKKKVTKENEQSWWTSDVQKARQSYCEPSTTDSLVDRSCILPAAQKQYENSKRCSTKTRYIEV